MRLIKFALALLSTLLIIWQLGVPHKAGDKSLPPLGDFFNPFTGFWKNAEPANVKGADIKTSIPGLKGPVEVVYDDLMIPHIFAASLEDAFRVQGYVTASNRLWQMDIVTRKASGRLSEVLGDRTKAIDRLTRRRGMGFAAENNVVNWKKSAESTRMLDAYTEGVNAYIAQLRPADYPIEFKLLGYAPEPWSMLKTAYVTESMAENLCSRDDDLESTNALALFGKPAFDSIYPEWDARTPPIVPDTGQWSNIKITQPRAGNVTPATLSGTETPENGLLSDSDLKGPDPYLRGSNNWAVGGSRTKSGRPILANDPHLNLTLPSIWFQLQVHTPEYSFSGASLPGVPGVIIGFNDDIAWGVTNASHDVSDWYKIKWSNPEHSRYILDGTAVNVTPRVETIHVKGQPDLIDTVRYTVFGPVVYDFDPKNPLRDCALRWISHDPPPADGSEVFIRLSMGKNFGDYKKALIDFDCPGQNFVYASRSGDIAIQVQGRFPVRAPEQGRFVQDGSLTANGWNDYIPEDEIPCLKNPSRGFVFSANQRSTPSSYPYYYLGNFDHYRSRRIYDRLNSMHGATVDSIKTMQLDNFSQRAADALPAMLGLLDRQRLDPDGRQLASELTGWNYRYESGMTTPGIFNMWWDSCYVRIWDEMDKNKTGQSLLYPETWHTIEMLTQDTTNRFFDHPNTTRRETARDIVLESFQAMEAYYKQHPDQKAPWGKVKGFAIKHLAQIDAFSRLDVVVGGDKSAPNAIGKTNGPSWRMIVDMGDPVHALGVYPGGQSGNPGSSFYDNMVNTWAKGEYYDILVLQSPQDKSDRILKRQTFVSK
jgi:penicillin amidase